MKRVAVTGSSGFIGSAVVRELTRRGTRVIPFDHPKDVRDVDELRACLRTADGVIHLAGALGTSEIFGNEAGAVATNIGGAVNVYDVASDLDIPVVQIGTGHKGQPNPYAITKACAEDLGLARARYADAKINVVRAYHVYGPGQKAIPPWGKSTVRKMVPTFICQALADIPLEIYGTGEQLIDLVYVDDVAEVLVDALEGPYGQLIEAGTGKPTSVTDAAWDVLRAAHGSAFGRTVKLCPMRPGEPEDATVVAGSPRCSNPWPYKLAETIDHYR